MPPVKEEQVVFVLGSPDRPGGPPTLIFGIPEAAWNYMQDGLCHDFDFSAIGVPLQALIFRGKDHDDIMRQIQEISAKTGVPILDERRRDFSTRRKRNGDGNPDGGGT